MTDTIVEVEENRTGRYTQTGRAGRHVLTMDEPVSVGGADAGPGPYDLLLLALGACTSMTIRMYAELKKLPLKQVRVRLVHRKIHAQDCLDCETKEGKVDEIMREVHLEGDLTDAERERVLEIAKRCPVAQTLQSEIKVRSRLVDAWGPATEEAG
jgi:putative redox protein